MKKGFESLILCVVCSLSSLACAQTATTGAAQGWPSRPIMPYDPQKDLAPVTITGEVPNGLVVHPTLPAKSVRELIVLAKQRPRELNYGSSGNGAGDHLAAEMLKVMAGIKMTHVPYIEFS